MKLPDCVISEVDPQGPQATALLRQAAVEARGLYAGQQRPDAPWPSNPPTPARGVYLVASIEGLAMACGALRPLDDEVAEVRRIFVAAPARRQGLARRLLEALEHEARSLGYSTLRLETGSRQQPAIALYAACGYRRISPYGEHVGDPTSVCFEKRLGARARARVEH